MSPAKYRPFCVLSANVLSLEPGHYYSTLFVIITDQYMYIYMNNLELNDLLITMSQFLVSASLLLKSGGVSLNKVSPT